ncbi:DUF4389 domain-containing protein [Streptomyces albidoflavus]|uniref:DUF4389 domain-containing protein n=1 Tax=Streptomyces albidoflavus TaxID=1886 RepID=UPI00101E2A1B|nr:DUF4389 domain-containing protein [Streptomyces albidoflavus]RZD55738.1 DUF4389 domain-containing protein [Streptomyces albidoflavus]
MTEGPWAGPIPPSAPPERLPQLDIPPPGPQRRLTVFFRLPLLVPHFVVLFFLHIAAWFATIATWFAALATARVPDPLYRFLAGYLGWATRVDAEAMLLVDRYPPFALHAPGYPVRVEVTGDRLNRLAVLFRLILLIPALIVQALASSGWWALGLIWWLIVLVMGRVPQPLFEASAAVLRFRMRTGAYAMMLTPAYPKGFFGDRPGALGTDTEEAEEVGRVTENLGDASGSATRPLVLGTPATVLLVVFLLAGLAGGASGSTSSYTTGDEPGRGPSPSPAVTDR